MPHFEFDGSQYEKASAHQTQWGQELISFLSLSGTESILDLGCGAVLKPFGGFRYKPKNKNSQRLFGDASPRPLGFFFTFIFLVTAPAALQSPAPNRWRPAPTRFPPSIPFSAG